MFKSTMGDKYRYEYYKMNFTIFLCLNVAKAALYIDCLL